MARKIYRIGIGLILAVILTVSIYLLYREKQQEKQYEDGVLVEREQEMDATWAGNGPDKNRWERERA